MDKRTLESIELRRTKARLEPGSASLRYYQDVGLLLDELKRATTRVADLEAEVAELTIEPHHPDHRVTRW